jgi:hypothetical protein
MSITKNSEAFHKFLEQHYNEENSDAMEYFQRPDAQSVHQKNLENFNSTRQSGNAVIQELSSNFVDLETFKF